MENEEELYAKAYNAYIQKEYEEASREFSKLAALRPFVPKYWKGIAASFQMNKQFREALDSWAMLALIDECSPLPHFHAAECLFYLNEKEEGIKALELAKRHVVLDELMEEKIENLRRLYGK